MIQEKKTEEFFADEFPNADKFKYRQQVLKRYRLKKTTLERDGETKVSFHLSIRSENNVGFSSVTNYSYPLPSDSSVYDYGGGYIEQAPHFALKHISQETGVDITQLKVQ